MNFFSELQKTESIILTIYFQSFLIRDCQNYTAQGKNMSDTKILLDESEIPTHWYNVIADMPNPPADSFMLTKANNSTSFNRK